MNGEAGMWFTGCAALGAVVLLLFGMAPAGAEGPLNVPDGTTLTQQAYGEPYAVAGNRLFFINWLYIRPGGLNWVDDAGNGVAANRSVMAGDWDAHYRTHDIPRGIRIVAQPAKRHGPAIKREMPWEQVGLRVYTLIHEGDKYRMWAGCQAADGKTRDCYFESTDGYTWTRPSMDMIEFEGSKDNNLTPGLFGGSLFVDPSAPPEERYKAIGTDTISQEEFDAYAKENPEGWEPKAFRNDVGHIYALKGAFSFDGFHWDPAPGIFSVEHADTQNTGYYDAQLKKYVLFTRTWWVNHRAPGAPEGGEAWFLVGRRSIGRSESDTFGDFPLSEKVLVSPPNMLPSEVLYTNCKTVIPGAPDHHLIFPGVWNMDSDATRLVMASSADGRLWNWVPGGTLLDTGEFGTYDGGCIFASPNLVEVPNGDFILPYTGYRYPHKYPRGTWAFDIGFAVWPKGRMVALEADDVGEFTTIAIVVPGKTLRINATTRRGGWLKIEACDLDGNPLAGHSFGDATPIIGDHYRSVVKWGDQEDLGVEPGAPVRLRFKMKQAKIFAIDFE